MAKLDYFQKISKYKKEFTYMTKTTIKRSKSENISQNNMDTGDKKKLHIFNLTPLN